VTQQHTTDEYLDLVDENDNVIGKKLRSQVYAEDLSNERELNEELDIDTNNVPHKFLGHLTPHEHSVSAFMNVYEIKMDSVPNYNPDDFVEYYWLTPEEFFERVKNGEKTKGDLPKLINFFYML